MSSAQTDIIYANWPDIIPIIATERLLMRDINQDDASFIQSIFSLWDVARMTGSIPHPFPEHSANGWISYRLGGMARHQRLDWLVTLAESNRPVGVISLFVRPHQPLDVWELGFSMHPDHWGQGYMTEAAAGVMDWGMEILGIRLYCAAHYTDNPASGRVLEKLGFAPYGPLREAFALSRGEKAPLKYYVWPGDIVAEAQQINAPTTPSEDL